MEIVITQMIWATITIVIVGVGMLACIGACYLIEQARKGDEYRERYHGGK